jgi:acetylornithine deacetylase/succinyl-diaminopimelate desuccinylase-like protein
MERVLDYLKQNQKRFLAEFCDYLRFASVSAQPQHKKDLLACAEWLVAHCQKIGLDARLCPTAGHPIVIAKTPGRKAESGKRKAENQN